MSDQSHFPVYTEGDATDLRGQIFRNLKIDAGVKPQAGLAIIFKNPGWVIGRPPGGEAGNIQMTGRTTAAAGWLMCDGTAVSRATYNELFAAIGTTYGVGDGSTTFNLPDMVGRFPIGSGTPANPAVTGGGPHALGTKGGEQTHQLTGAESATHNHGAVTGAGSAHNHGITDPTHTHDMATFWAGAANGVLNRASSNGTGGAGVLSQNNTAIITAKATGITINNEAAHTHAIGNDGGNGFHNNEPQYTTVNFMIKT